jgi:hypothetical protein
MQFAKRCQRGLASVLLFISITAHAMLNQAAIDQPPADRVKHRMQVRVLVYNHAQVPAAILRSAQREEVRIFAEAGINLMWVSCSPGNESHECGNAPAPEELVIHIIPKGKGVGDSVYGEAYMAEDGAGQYADVFFGRILANHIDGLSPSQLLAAVAAHEIGHLLLGPHAHSWAGIMEPQWSTESLHRIAMGDLLFNHDQALRMRDNLTRRNGSAKQVARTSE